MENRASVIRKVTEFVTASYGGDWQKAFDAFAVGGQIDRPAVVGILEEANVGTLIGRPFIAAQVMELFDSNGDGYLTFAEFDAIAKVTPPPAPK